MGTLQTAFNSLLTKLDADAGVDDTDYSSSLATSQASTIEIPDDILFPLPESDKEKELYRILSDYFVQLRQTLSEIESKLP